jgi:hypothetical protein
VPGRLSPTVTSMSNAGMFSPSIGLGMVMSSNRRVPVQLAVGTTMNECLVPAASLSSLVATGLGLAMAKDSAWRDDTDSTSTPVLVRLAMTRAFTAGDVASAASSAC